MTKTNWSTWTCRAAVAALVATLLGPAGVSAQSAEVCEVDGVRGGETLTVQPKIIVIPYTKDGENMGTVLAEAPYRRVAVGGSNRHDVCLPRQHTEHHQRHRREDDPPRVAYLNL